MNYSNLTQSTYDRLCEREADGIAQTAIDVADLLEAYENATILLNKLAATGASIISDEVYDFLNTPNGDPRVDITEEE